MRLREYFGMILSSLNPNEHKKLVKKPLFDLLKYFAFVMLLGILLSVVVMIPMLYGYQESLGGELGEFKKFNVKTDVSLDEPVTILKRPAVVVDFTKEELTNQWILVTNSSVLYKKFIFFGREEIKFSDYQNVDDMESTSLYAKIMVFLLPAMLFWIMVLYGIKYVILSIIFSVLGWVFFISRKNQVTNIQ